MGPRESQREGVEERKEASAREGWKGEALEERRFFFNYVEMTKGGEE